jgi:hypothetical protein
MKRMLLPLAGAVAALLASACGSEVTGPIAPPPTSPPQVVLQQQDAGRTITVAPGTVVQVRLQETLSQHPAPATPALTWSAASSTPTVLAPDATSREVNPGGRFDVYVADFSARTAGTARVLANAAQSCTTAQGSPACAMRQIVFTIDVS